MSASRTPPSERPRNSGFHALVNGASLVELIQLNCLGQQRAAFEVTSGVRRGLMFFQGGRVVHAEFDGEEGLVAVQRMLALESGRFRPSHTTWPGRETIAVSWQALVLQAAQANDEAQAALPDPTGELVEFPGVNKTMEDDATHPGRLAVIRLSAQGEVTQQTSHPRALTDAAAYLVQVGDAIGDSLGLGPLLELEASSAENELAVFREADGGALVVSGPVEEVRQMKETRRR